MPKKLSKETFISALPVFLAVIPFITSVLLFLLALILIELSGGLGVDSQTTFQQLLQTIGDISAGLAYLSFSLLTPLGIIAAVIIAVVRFVTRRRGN